MAETAAGGGSDDDSDQLVSIHEAAENCNVVQLQRALAAGVSPNIIEISSPSTELISERQRMRRVYPLLLAAGATLPTEASDPYLLRVMQAGSFANYARRHLDTLTNMLTPKSAPAHGPRRSRRRLSPLRRVPPEVLRRIVAFAFHVGYY